MLHNLPRAELDCALGSTSFSFSIASGAFACPSLLLFLPPCTLEVAPAPSEVPCLKSNDWLFKAISDFYVTMRVSSLGGFVVWGLFTQQAVASYSWNDAQKYSSPNNTNNQCSTEQVDGWHFDSIGQQVSTFDGMELSGFTCQDPSHAGFVRRAVVNQTQFSSKALVGNATNNDASCPRITSSSRDFSIDEMLVSVDQDSELTLEYIMSNGDICRQVTQCLTTSTTVKNTQCGGAKELRVKGDCAFAIYSISFECGPSPPVSTSTSSITTKTVSRPPATTSCAETESKNEKGSCLFNTSTGSTATTTLTTSPVSTTLTTPTACQGNGTWQTTSPCLLGTSNSGVTSLFTCATSMSPVSGPVSGGCSPLQTTTTPTASACGNNGTCSHSWCHSPASVGGTTATLSKPTGVVTSKLTVTTLTTCPITVSSSGTTSVIQTVSTIITTSTITFCPKCSHGPASSTIDSSLPFSICKTGEELQGGKCTPLSSTKNSSWATRSISPTSSTTTNLPPAVNASVAPEVPCPPVLPRCLNTWLQQSDSCASNSDIACFCPSVGLIASVQECVSAWGESDADIQTALSFLAGICADFVSENPG